MFSFINTPYLIFVLAYIILIATILRICYITDSSLDEDEKKSLAEKISSSQSSPWTSKRLLVLIHSFFNSYFGKEHFNINCFYKSAIVSVALFFFLYQFQILYYPETSQDFGQKQIILASTFAVILNIPVDYLSLYKSRILLNTIIKSNSKVTQLTFAFMSLFFSALIFLLLGFVIINILNWCHYKFGSNPNEYQFVKLSYWTHNLPFNNFGGFQSQVFRAGFFTTFLTSIWSMIFLISLVFVKPLQILKIDKIIKIKNETFTHLGIVFSIFTLICFVIFIISMLF